MLDITIWLLCGFFFGFLMGVLVMRPPLRDPSIQDDLTSNNDELNKMKSILDRRYERRLEHKSKENNS